MISYLRTRKRGWVKAVFNLQFITHLTFHWVMSVMCRPCFSLTLLWTTHKTLELVYLFVEKCNLHFQTSVVTWPPKKNLFMIMQGFENMKIDMVWHFKLFLSGTIPLCYRWKEQKSLPQGGRNVLERMLNLTSNI